MLLATYQRGAKLYQRVSCDGTTEQPKAGYTMVALEWRPSCMDTARGRSNCTRQLRTRTRRQAEPKTYRGGILCQRS